MFYKDAIPMGLNVAQYQITSSLQRTMLCIKPRNDAKNCEDVSDDKRIDVDMEEQMFKYILKHRPSPQRGEG